jgi:tetratricopeptide (TPR) repeat protein
MGVRRRRFLLWCAVLQLAFCLFSGTSRSQTTGSQSSADQAIDPAVTESRTQKAESAAEGKDPERQQAIALYQQGKMVQAMPLFESLCAKYPMDSALWEAWAATTLNYSQTLTDPDQRKRVRARSRTLLLKAKELGDNSNLLQVLLGMIPEDGGNSTFSPRKEVNEAMQRAEADFSRGDLDKAREGYMHAYLLDPTLYEAPLFIGDVFYKQHLAGSSGEWFAHAIEIDPDRETAYRYWGDALSSLGKTDEARAKFIQAVIAEPYGKNSWVGLTQWADRTKVKLNWVRLQNKGEVSKTDDQHISITLDPGSLGKHDPSGAAWTAYSMNVALWQMQTFKKEFPNERQYRHTTREEADSLHMMASVLRAQKNYEKKKKDLDPALVQVVEIDQAGLLEPFVLLNRVNNDIAKDFTAYRKANRDKLYRYFDEIVVPKAPMPK